MRETSRLYAVLDRQLEHREFVAGDGYSVADIAIYPWTLGHERQRQQITDFPNVARWIDTIRARPATQRAYAWVQKVNPPKAATPDEEAARRRVLFEQSAATLRAVA